MSCPAGRLSLNPPTRTSMTTRNRVASWSLGLALAAFAAMPAGAQELTLDKLAVHGYGGWSFGRTTDNLNTNFFLFAHQRGDYFHNEFALNVTAQLSEQLSIVAQPFWHSGHHANQTASGMDYVFGEWKFSDAVRLRVGNVKQPFGIYTEVFDVGTLRPFAALSQSIYGPSGMIGKSYSGVGVTGALFANRSLGIEYDIYGGGLETLEEDTPLQMMAQVMDTVGRPALNAASTRTWRDVLGGRVILRTPLDGFSVGASGYSGTRPITRGTIAKDWRRTVVGAHADYTGDAWWLRGEMANERDEDNFTAKGMYVEGAYRLSTRFQLAATYGTFDTEMENLPAANVAKGKSLLEHAETGFGVNYWFSTNFVVKSSYHIVTGNRFAHPDPATRFRNLAYNGNLMNETNAVLVSAHLSF
jgi:hypothetical protein